MGAGRVNRAALALEKAGEGDDAAACHTHFAQLAADFATFRELAEQLDLRRRVALKVDLSDTTSAQTPKDLIALTASAAINPASFGDTFVNAVDQPISLCIAMQAARRAVLTGLSPDRPLMLSHYY